MIFLIHIIKVSILFFYASSALQAEPILSDSGNYTINRNLSIPVPTSLSDPTIINLVGDVRLPVEAQNNPNKRFPVVIYIASWGLPALEYDVPAAVLADQGYIVLSYVSRGFYASEGLVEVASDNDTRDGIEVINWMLENYPVNPDAIGVGGISYGAGIALRMATKDERIRAIVAQSGWSNLTESLAYNLTGRVDWFALLLAVGNATGNLSPEIDENLNNVIEQINVPETIDWGNSRSPIFDWDTVNAYKNPPAILAGNNANDYLFQPDSMIDLMKIHQGPKRYQIQAGTHGQSEIIGALSILDDEVWQNQFTWFNHYLKGEKNGIQCLEPVNWIVNSSYFFNRANESLSSFDSPVDYNSVTYSLSSDNNANNGVLQATPHNRGTQTLTYDTETAEMSSGLLIEQVLGHPDIQINNIDTNNALVFKGPILNNGLKIRGNVNLSLQVLAQSSSQYFAYLVEVNPNGIASWITHAPFAVFPTDGSVLIGSKLTNIDIELYWSMYDVRPGNYIALIVDSRDPGYIRSKFIPETSTIVLSDIAQSTLSIPHTTQNHPPVTLKNSTPEQLDCVDDNPPELNLGIIEVNPPSRSIQQTTSNNISSGSSNLLFWFMLMIALRQKKYRLLSKI